MGQRQALELIAASAEERHLTEHLRLRKDRKCGFLVLLFLFFLGFWVVFSVWGF